MNEVSGIPRRSWWSTAFRFDSADNRDSFQPNHNLHFSTQPLFVFSTQYTIGFNWPKKQKDSFYHFENRFKDFTNMDQNIIIFVVWQPIWIVGEGLCQLCHQEVLNDELSMCITCLLTAVLREESCKNAITFLVSSGQGKTYYISMHGPRGVYIKWDAQSICTATRWKYCVKIHLLWEEICFLI